MFRTPIGFHDAYVAAPSQKAALEAWGANTNLFAQGAAEQVTEPKLTKVPLEHPGEVIKVLRGSEAEQLKALGASSKRRASAHNAPSSKPSPANGRGETAEPGEGGSGGGGAGQAGRGARQAAGEAA